MRTITVEEHFASPGLLDAAGSKLKERFLGRGSRGARIIEQLAEVGDKRVAEMDAAGIDMQVLSLNAPGTEQLDSSDALALASASNDYLAGAVNAHPARFAGLAALPTAVPDKAAEELQRAVGKLGFKGAVINGHARGRYLDDKFFWPILERATALGVPIYLHPTVPPKAVVEASYDGFSPAVTEALAASAWGWHIETAIHVIRMILGGVFDRFPTLQVVIGHLGEGLPFMLPRLDRNLPREVTNLERPVAEYLRQNIHYTFAGFNFPATFLNLLLEIGVSRILFSADYPYGSMIAARAFLEQLSVNDADRERIAHANAEQLFRL